MGRSKKFVGKEILRSMIGGEPSQIKTSGSAVKISYDFGDSTKVEIRFRKSDSTGRAVDVVVIDKDSGRESLRAKHVDSDDD